MGAREEKVVSWLTLLQNFIRKLKEKQDGL